MRGNVEVREPGKTGSTFETENCSLDSNLLLHPYLLEFRGCERMDFD